MRTFLISSIYFLSSASLYAQTKPDSLKDDTFSWRNATFTLKTDVLPLMNSAIERGTTDISVSGELCFNREYSLQLNTAYENKSEPDNSISVFSAGMELRGYVLKDFCSCSSIHAGAYFSFNEAMNTIDHRNHEDSYLKYNASRFETGLTGGYRGVLYNHWIIDPTIYAGVSSVYHVRTIESHNFSMNEKPAMLVIRIALEIGYRF